MRISQLAAESGVSVPTIKYYLREGLLPAGQLTAATQAEYDETHVRRLRLIRALVGHAGLSVAATRELLAAVDDPPARAHDLLGVAHHALLAKAEADAAPTDADAERDERMRATLERAGWDLHDVDPRALAAVATAYQHIEESGLRYPDSLFLAYLDAAAALARAEVDHVPTDSPESALSYVSVGVVLAEPLLLALRRLAEQIESARRFGDRGLG